MWGSVLRRSSVLAVQTAHLHFLSLRVSTGEVAFVEVAFGGGDGLSLKLAAPRPCEATFCCLDADRWSSYADVSPCSGTHAFQKCRMCREVYHAFGYGSLGSPTPHCCRTCYDPTREARPWYSVALAFGHMTIWNKEGRFQNDYRMVCMPAQQCSPAGVLHNHEAFRMTLLEFLQLNGRYKDDMARFTTRFPEVRLTGSAPEDDVSTAIWIMRENVKHKTLGSLFGCDSIPFYHVALSRVHCTLRDLIDPVIHERTQYRLVHYECNFWVWSGQEQEPRQCTSFDEPFWGRGSDGPFRVVVDLAPHMVLSPAKAVVPEVEVPVVVLPTEASARESFKAFLDYHRPGHAPEQVIPFTPMACRDDASVLVPLKINEKHVATWQAAGVDVSPCWEKSDLALVRFPVPDNAAKERFLRRWFKLTYAKQKSDTNPALCELMTCMLREQLQRKDVPFLFKSHCNAKHPMEESQANLAKSKSSFVDVAQWNALLVAWELPGIDFNDFKVAPATPPSALVKSKPIPATSKSKSKPQPKRKLEPKAEMEVDTKTCEQQPVVNYWELVHSPKTSYRPKSSLGMLQVMVDKKVVREVPELTNQVDFERRCATSFPGELAADQDTCALINLRYYHGRKSIEDLSPFTMHVDALFNGDDKTFLGGVDFSTASRVLIYIRTRFQGPHRTRVVTPATDVDQLLKHCAQHTLEDLTYEYGCEHFWQLCVYARGNYQQMRALSKSTAPPAIPPPPVPLAETESATAKPKLTRDQIECDLWLLLEEGATISFTGATEDEWAVRMCEAKTGRPLYETPHMDDAVLLPKCGRMLPGEIASRKNLFLPLALLCKGNAELMRSHCAGVNILARAEVMKASKNKQEIDKLGILIDDEHRRFTTRVNDEDFLDSLKDRTLEQLTLEWGCVAFWNLAYRCKCDEAKMRTYTRAQPEDQNKRVKADPVEVTFPEEPEAVQSLAVVPCEIITTVHELTFVTCASEPQDVSTFGPWKRLCRIGVGPVSMEVIGETQTVDLRPVALRNNQRMLNTDHIDLLRELLVQRGTRVPQANVHRLNSHFLDLSDTLDEDRLRSWLPPTLDHRSTELIVFEMFDEAHFFVVAYCVEADKFLVFDSLGQDHVWVATALRMVLRRAYGKNACPAEEDALVVQCPQQERGTMDCGLFASQASYELCTRGLAAVQWTFDQRTFRPRASVHADWPTVQEISSLRQSLLDYVLGMPVVQEVFPVRAEDDVIIVSERKSPVKRERSITLPEGASSSEDVLPQPVTAKMRLDTTSSSDDGKGIDVE